MRNRNGDNKKDLKGVKMSPPDILVYQRVVIITILFCNT